MKQFDLILSPGDFQSRKKFKESQQNYEEKKR